MHITIPRFWLKDSFLKPLLILMSICSVVFTIAAGFDNWNWLAIPGSIFWLFCVIGATSKEKGIYSFWSEKTRRIAMLYSICVPLLLSFVIIRPLTQMLVNGVPHQGFSGLVIPFVTEVEPLAEEKHLYLNTTARTSDGVTVSAYITTKVILLLDKPQSWRPERQSSAMAKDLLTQAFQQAVKDLKALELGNTVQIEFSTGSQTQLASVGLALQGPLKVTDIHASF